MASMKQQAAPPEGTLSVREWTTSWCRLHGRKLQPQVIWRLLRLDQGDPRREALPRYEMLEGQVWLFASEVATWLPPSMRPLTRHPGRRDKQEPRPRRAREARSGQRDSGVPIGSPEGFAGLLDAFNRAQDRVTLAYMPAQGGTVRIVAILDRAPTGRHVAELKTEDAATTLSGWLDLLKLVLTAV